MNSTPKYRRVLLKLSGEALRGEQSSGFDAAMLEQVGDRLVELHSLGLTIGLVVGGGNFVRGEQTSSHMPWFPREAADGIGMLATLMNGLALRELLRHKNLPCQLFGAAGVDNLVRRYSYEAVQAALADREIVIFAGGTGHPFFTTDTTAALRARQMDAELLIKATNVDGVYDRDPHVHDDAKRFAQLTFTEVLTRNLRVMDATGISFCREYRLPILVVNIHNEDHLKRAIMGDSVGTLIHHRDR